MPKISGRKISVGFGKEETRGVAVSPTVWYPRIDLDFDEKVESVENESSIGVIVDTVDTEIVRQYAEGPIGGNLAVNAMSLPLYAIFGKVDTTTDSNGAYKHKFSLENTNIRPSLTVAMHDPIAPYKFAMGTVKKIKFKYEQNKYIDVSIEFVAKKGEADGSLTPAFGKEYYLLGRHTKVSFAENLAGLDAAQATCIRSLDLEIDLKVEEDYCLGSITPSDFLNTSVSITGTIETTYQNEETYKKKSLDGTTQAMRILSKDENTTIGESSHPTMKIDLAKIKFKEWARKMGNNEIVTQTCKFHALFSVEDAQAIVAELVNTTSTI